MQKFSAADDDDEDQDGHRTEIDFFQLDPSLPLFLYFRLINAVDSK